MYCENCHGERETHTVTKELVFNVKGESIPVIGDVLLCNDCGEELFDEELDSQTLDASYTTYRQRHDLLQPAQIEAIRNRYNLSAADFALSLGMGEKTVTRYENGGIQSNVHNMLMEFAQNELIMRQMFEKNQTMLPNEVKERVEEKLFGKRAIASGTRTSYTKLTRFKSVRNSNSCVAHPSGPHPSFCYQNDYVELANAS